MKKKEIAKAALQFLISILTAAATALGTTACMGHVPQIM
ncbi:MAG: smalltalk protein [Bacteroidaceae bacterium]|nr:smalltalk protein [Bacteroidaceae bacterium]